MMLDTYIGAQIDQAVLNNYFGYLVNLFFKILPIRENERDTLCAYMESLQAEMLGCSNIIVAVHSDPMYLSLLSILQYLIDHPACEMKVIRREVFKAISICNKLKSRYSCTSDEVTKV